MLDTRFTDADHGAKCFAGEVDDFIYTRINNPTVRELEQAMAMLEHGSEAICTSSGMGAANVVFFALLGQGKHIICHETCYGPSRSVSRHLAHFLPPSCNHAISKALAHGDPPFPDVFRCWCRARPKRSTLGCWFEHRYSSHNTHVME